MSTTTSVTRALVTAPLPQIIEKLGLAIAEAQFALDSNSVEIAKQMSETEVEIGDETYNLLSLGFQPSFYAFTEATVEAKLSIASTATTNMYSPVARISLLLVSCSTLHQLNY